MSVRLQVLADLPDEREEGEVTLALYRIATDDFRSFFRPGEPRTGFFLHSLFRQQ